MEALTHPSATKLHLVCMMHFLSLPSFLTAPLEWTVTAFRVALGANTSQLSYAVPTLESINVTSIPKPQRGESEDCLFLDVFVPEKIFDARQTSARGKFTAKYFPHPN